MNLLDHLRAEGRWAPNSGISAIADRGRGRDGVIPLWIGEGDLQTPAFIADRAANVGLAPGGPFGGEGFFRLCFHRRLDQIEEAARRLAEWIDRP